MEKMEKVLHAQMPFTTGGQTINDRLTAAYHSLAGSQLAKTVCKATTEEPMGPKKKHLDYLLHCTHEPNVSIPQLANLMVERATNTNWCVVFKSLITIHNLMCYGNERFSQYLASSNANFQLVNFLDKASVQGYDMSTHVRRYAKYISEKVYTYRMMAFDFCKVKRGREDGLLRTMPTEKLLKTLPLLQGQVDALLEFQVQSQELTNGVINSCFILLFRDLIRLFACYNDGIINLLEKYFDMNKKQCREALDLYKNFLNRMDKVAEFLKVAEAVGIDRGEIPDLAKAPSSLMEALEQHLNALEGGKTSGGGSRVTSPATVSATRSAIENLSTFHEPGYVDTSSMDEATKRKLLEEEQDRLNTLKEQRLREIEFNQQKSGGGQKTNPFLPSPSAAPGSSSNQGVRASEDLLSLDFGSPQAPQAPTNPFAASAGVGMGGGGGGGGASLFGAQPSPQPFGAPAWGAAPAGYPSLAMATNGHQYQSNAGMNGSSASGFASDDSFAKAFGGGGPAQQQQQQQQTSSGGGGGELQPMPGPPSRGISPSPDDMAVAGGGAGFNPFLTGDTGGGGGPEAGAWQSPAHTGASIGGDSGFGDAGSDFGQRPTGGGAAQFMNPFAAFQQNAEALNSATETSTALADETPSPPSVTPQSMFYGAGGQVMPPPSGYSSMYPALAQTPGMEGMDAAAKAQMLGSHPQSGRSSALDSPAVMASPSHAGQQQQMQSSSPMPIPGGGGGLNIYQHTPFSNMDASYTASPQLPRHMQQQQASPMATSYTPGGSAAYGGGSGQQTPARPPSAPPTELGGLDPFGDMLTPMGTGGGGGGGYGMQQQQATGGAALFGQPAGMQAQKKLDGKLVKGDLDSSLASLAQNLNIGGGHEALKNKPVQWGGAAKGQQAAAPPAQVPVGPMGAPMWGAPAAGGGVPAAAAWGATPGYPPQAAPGVWGAQPGGMMPGMAPMGGYGQPRPPMYGAPGAGGMGMGGGMQAAGGGGAMFGQQPQRMANPQDPFGAL